MILLQNILFVFLLKWIKTAQLSQKQCIQENPTFYFILFIFSQQLTVPNYASTSPSVSREAMSLGINLQDPPALRTDVPSASFALFHLAWQPHASHLGAERAARRLSSAARWRRRQGDGLRRWRPHTFSKASAEGLNDEARKIENIGACRSGTSEGFF